MTAAFEIAHLIGATVHHGDSYRRSYRPVAETLALATESALTAAIAEIELAPGRDPWRSERALGWLRDELASRTAVTP